MLVSQTGKHLSDLQSEILHGTWEGNTYEAIAQAAYCTEGHVKDVAADFWKQLSELLGERIGKKNCKSVLGRHFSLQSPPELSHTVTKTPAATAPHLDWGDAPDIHTLFGRTEELSALQQWILSDRCRAIALLGMGGIGKTSLASTLARTIQTEFDWIAWRSLRNSPTVRDLLTDLLKSLPAPDAFQMPAKFDAQLRELLDRLRQARGLLVLDNLESILQGGDRLSPYRQGYEEYGELFRVIGETGHNSCLLVTSRELPQGWNRLASNTQAVRQFPIIGLSLESARELLQSKGAFTGSERDWQRSTEHYAGNPLALNIVASTILDFFDGSLTQFLDFTDKESFVLDDIRELLDRHLDRL
ncbi:MAG: ATP-binding protein, partial [Cyanobacteria bacterium P01_D01_bin.123]